MTDEPMKIKNCELDLPRTIYAHFEHYRLLGLKKGLEDWATENNCQIHWGDSLDIKLLNLNAFVMIIDRTMVPARLYDYYLQWCEGSVDIKIVEEVIVHSNRTRNIIHRSEELVVVEDHKVGNNEFCNDVCIFIDNLIELPLPRTKLVHVINPDEPRFTDWVVNITQMAYKTVFDRLYKTVK